MATMGIFLRMLTTVCEEQKGDSMEFNSYRFLFFFFIFNKYNNMSSLLEINNAHSQIAPYSFNLANTLQ